MNEKNEVQDEVVLSVEDEKEIVSALPVIEKKTKKLRGVGFTRKNKDQSHKKIKQEKKSRKINKKIANKKSRPTGSKKRK